MNRGQLGYADLVHVVDRFPAAPRDVIAEFLGWEVRPPRLPREHSPSVDTTPEPNEPQGPGTAAPLVDEPTAPWPTADEPAMFWRATQLKDHGKATPGAEPKKRGRLRWRGGEKLPTPKAKPLCPWEALIPRLRAGLLARAGGGRVDWGRVVERVARGESLHRFPRRSYRRWGEHVQIIFDRSDHLIPYWDDQDWALDRLKGVIPPHGLDVIVGSSPSTGAIQEFAAEGPTGTVLVLGDLGGLQFGGAAVQDEWRAWGLALRKNGCRPLALVPCAVERIPAALHQAFTVISWQRLPYAHLRHPGDRQKAVDDLLVRVAPAVRLEPGLLRAIRTLLTDPPEAADDASLEAELWQHPFLVSPHPSAATIDPQRARKDLMPRFEALDQSTRTSVLTEVRRWRQPLSPEVWLSEYLRVAAGSRAAMPRKDNEKDSEDARRLLTHLVGLTTARENAAIAFSARALERLPDTTWNDPVFGPLSRRLHRSCFPDGPRPPGWAPEDYEPGETTLTFEIRQRGEELLFLPTTTRGTEGRSAGSPLGVLATTNTIIQAQVAAQPPDLSFWEGGVAPPWAHQWGLDEHGPWVRLRVGSVIQRMRWIPPGTFLMGSPETEEGRWHDEGPQHEVTLSQGFWMFDTPCTQELWQAVMGLNTKNPSGFPGTRRPVECVSYEDVTKFVGKINEQLPGLALTLPTEAQWEYACRATTTGPRYGPLDDVAWHGGNSGNQTHEVGLMAPNGWGLYDMLGNVLEWCIDGMRQYTINRQTNPISPMVAGGGRVFRGGGWRYPAQYLRAAYRDVFPLGRRSPYLGFRCLRSGGFRPERVEPTTEVVARKAGPGPQPEQTNGTTEVKWDSPDTGRCAILRAPRILIRTDVEDLTLECTPRPAWAAASGRDRFGLWSDLEIRSKTRATARQRLRWVPPGRFLMGSPDTEVGRDVNEGPQHEVVISKGFWMFDTPCTQELWGTVMGPQKNPSEYKDPRRPVESVSFEDVSVFLKSIEEQVPGLGLTLPTEAQWEYACRAGTTTSTYAGDVEILGYNNAPGLDAIAWYGGNSGRDYDLKSGFDTTKWREKQYLDTKAGTRKVGQKRRNGWGLYDMLGNVLEWCADGWRKYTKERQVDPVGPQAAGADRVFRGGSWSDYAQYVRAASRLAFPPVSRDDDLGFRCLSSGGQGERQGEGVGEEGAGRSGGGAERRPRPTSTPPNRGSRKG